jgi:cell division protein FtsB
MGKRSRSQKVSIERLIAVSALSISAAFLLAFGGQIIEIYRLRATLAIANERVASLQAEQAALEATRAYVESDEYAERVAREELNKIRPGDRRTIIVPRPAPEPTALPEEAPSDQALAPGSYLGHWWELLFGQ